MSEKLTKNSPSLGREAVYLKESKLQKLPEYLAVHLVRFYYKADVKKKAKVWVGDVTHVTRGLVNSAHFWALPRAG